jgi:hypothetical protein
MRGICVDVSTQQLLENLALVVAAAPGPDWIDRAAPPDEMPARVVKALGCFEPVFDHAGAIIAVKFHIFVQPAVAAQSTRQAQGAPHGFMRTGLG